MLFKNPAKNCPQSRIQKVHVKMLLKNPTENCPQTRIQKVRVKICEVEILAFFLLLIRIKKHFL